MMKSFYTNTEEAPSISPYFLLTPITPVGKKWIVRVLRTRPSTERTYTLAAYIGYHRPGEVAETEGVNEQKRGSCLILSFEYNTLPCMLQESIESATVSRVERVGGYGETALGSSLMAFLKRSDFVNPVVDMQGICRYARTRNIEMRSPHQKFHVHLVGLERTTCTCFGQNCESCSNQAHLDSQGE